MTNQEFEIKLILRPGLIHKSPNKDDFELLENHCIAAKMLTLSAFCESLHKSTFSSFSISGFKGAYSELPVDSHLCAFLQQYPMAIFSAKTLQEFDLEFYLDENSNPNDYLLLTFEANQDGYTVARSNYEESLYTGQSERSSLRISQNRLIDQFKTIQVDLAAYLHQYAPNDFTKLEEFWILSPDSDNQNIRETYNELYRLYEH